MLLCGGIIALTSCSDSIYQEIDEQNNEMNAPPTFIDDASGGFAGGGFNNLALNYFSPWDIWWNRGPDYVSFQPSYVISNGGAIGENYSPYTLEVFAWIGLAYFDGDNDGRFYDHSLGAGSPPVADMIATPGQYQNLFVNNQEVGNLVRTNTPLTFQPLEGARIEDLQDHLPMPGGTDPRYPSWTPPWAFGPWADGFDCTGTLQPLEIDLLREYGKVFFYEVNVFEAGAFVGTYFLHPDIQTLYNGSVSKWEVVTDVPGGTIHLQGNFPPIGNFPLYYYTDTARPLDKTEFDPGKGGIGNFCNSYEVVFDARDLYQHTITGSMPKTLTMDIWQDTPTFWQRSALHLRVH